jgi:imidazolonepropionase
MSSLLLTGIGELVTNDPVHDGTPLGLVRDAAVVLEGSRVAWVGPRLDAPDADAAREPIGIGCGVTHVLKYANWRHSTEFNRRALSPHHDSGTVTVENPLTVAARHWKRTANQIAG